jgi:hypothetical protein
VSRNLLKTKYTFVVALLALMPAVLPLLGSEHHGTVKFGGLPLPGAVVTAKQGDKSVNAITNPDGVYSFDNLADGAWTIQVEMPLFARTQQELTVGAGTAPAADFDLKLLPPDQIAAMVTAAPRLQVAETPAAPQPVARKGKAAPPAPTNTKAAFQRTDLGCAGRQHRHPCSAAETGVPQDASLSQRAADGLLSTAA